MNNSATSSTGELRVDIDCFVFLVSYCGFVSE